MQVETEEKRREVQRSTESEEWSLMKEFEQRIERAGASRKREEERRRMTDEESLTWPMV